MPCIEIKQIGHLPELLLLDGLIGDEQVGAWLADCDHALAFKDEKIGGYF